VKFIVYIYRLLSSHTLFFGYIDIFNIFFLIFAIDTVL